MNKRISLWVSISVALVLCVATFLVTATVMNMAYIDRLNEVNRGETSSYENMYDKLKEIETLVDNVFVGEVDKEALEDAVCSAYLAALGDKYTMYHTSEEMEGYLSTSEGNYVGVGVRVTFDEETGGIYIIAVTPGSPAEKGGILPGDIIVEVEGVKSNADNYNDVVDLVKGKAGTEVTFKYLRGSESKTVTLTRAKVVDISASYRNVDGIAVIEVTQFTQTTASDFEKALEKAKEDKVSGYIFDMRGNGGGDLNAIVDVLEMLLPEGNLILTATDKNGTVVQSYKDETEERLDAPMAVLIDGGTASAAELFTSALRDYEMAVTVGTTTYGKGEMQNLALLSDGSGVRITTHFYNPPCGVNYEGIGIVPDVECTLTEEQLKNFYMLTDEEDPQLQAALKELK